MNFGFAEDVEIVMLFLSVWLERIGRRDGRDWGDWIRRVFGIDAL